MRQKCDENCRGYETCKRLEMIDSICEMTTEEIKEMVEYDKDGKLNNFMDELFRPMKEEIEQESDYD
jgi:hypothetical protein